MNQRVVSVVSSIEAVQKNQCKKVAQVRGDGHVHRDPDHRFGTNPCSEIILRDAEFCNLTEVVVRENDTVESLKERFDLQPFLEHGSQLLTNFRYLSSTWKKNCEEERLLGVSLTGIMDCETTRCVDNLAFKLEELRRVAIDTNKEFANKIGIPQSAATTCVKPSGNCVTIS